MEELKLECQELLSKFLCPLACDLSTLPNSNSCPFGHHRDQSKSPRNEQQLKILPSYCCASFLVLKCSKREYTFKSGINSSFILTRCSDGFHVELSELDDLEMFKEKMIRLLLDASDLDQLDSKFVGLVPGDCSPIEMQNQIPSNSKLKRPHVDVDDVDDESSCAICLNRLSNNQTPFGLLEGCSHVFCAMCIQKWQNEGTKEDCPMCRKPISKSLVWPNLVKTQAEKMKLFELINGEVPSDERIDRAIDSSIPTYFTTSDGETIRAQQMHPENMKVFLKKPKPNWNCYLIKSKDDADDSAPVPNNVSTNDNRIDANTVEAIFNIINNPTTGRNVSSDNPSTPPSLRRQRRLQREIDNLRQIRVLGNPPTISDSD